MHWLDHAGALPRRCERLELDDAASRPRVFVYERACGLFVYDVYEQPCTP